MDGSIGGQKERRYQEKATSDDRNRSPTTGARNGRIEGFTREGMAGTLHHEIAPKTYQ
jgi:hypothetical protein